MFRKLICIILVMASLTGCTSLKFQHSQYKATYLTLFDTVTTILGNAKSEEVFNKKAQSIYDELLEYHQLFDIYHSYPNINNLKTINDQAGIEPVVVDVKIIELLEKCRDYYILTDRRVNVMLGSVLELWHDTRQYGLEHSEDAYLPDAEDLQAASKHADFDALLIDREAGTVYLSDPKARLDVGAVAKGWAAEQVSEHAPNGFLISIGGNVCVTGPKDQKGTPWIIGIQDPENPDQYVHTLSVLDGSIVTSGDYQRTYTVSGEEYHHIIDPDTLFPSQYWKSVTVVCSDSSLADVLSTALFLLPRDQGQKILEKYSAAAMWISESGDQFYSPDFQKIIRT